MHIFITGGTRGIGNGLAKVFLCNNHKVSLTGTSQNSIDKACESISGEFQSLICDVRNNKDIELAAKNAIEKFGNIDIWINNAGVSQATKMLDELTEVEIRKVVDTNVLGTMLGTNIAIKLMKEQGYGQIYNLEGLGSNDMIIPKTIVYGSTKRLITYFTKGCKKELKSEKNIKIGTINPGMVFTDLLMDNMEEDGMKIANILGNEVDYAANKIYEGIIKQRQSIKVTNTFQILLRFIKSIFVKGRQNEKS